MEAAKAEWKEAGKQRKQAIEKLKQPLRSTTITQEFVDATLKSSRVGDFVDELARLHPIRDYRTVTKIQFCSLISESFPTAPCRG